MSTFVKEMEPAMSGLKAHRLSAYFRRVLTAALIVCPVLLAIMAAYWLQNLYEDFPEESLWDPLAGFFMGFPCLFATGLAAPFGMPHTAYVFVGVAIDGLFWAFFGVSIHSVFRWLVQRRRFSDATRIA